MHTSEPITAQDFVNKASQCSHWLMLYFQLAKLTCKQEKVQVRPHVIILCNIHGNLAYNKVLTGNIRYDLFIKSQLKMKLYMGKLDVEKLQSYAVPLAQLINYFQIIRVIPAFGD